MSISCGIVGEHGNRHAGLTQKPNSDGFPSSFFISCTRLAAVPVFTTVPGPDRSSGILLGS